MAKIYFHVDVNSAFLSWSALKALQDGGTVDLRTIPAVVGGDETKRHGVVLAKSGPAKQYGIKTGESLFAARTKCPGLTIVPPDFDWYVQNSKALIQILNDYTPDVEQYSIDEAFLDMTGTEALFGPPLTAPPPRTPRAGLYGQCGHRPQPPTCQDGLGLSKAGQGPHPLSVRGGKKDVAAAGGGAVRGRPQRGQKAEQLRHLYNRKSGRTGPGHSGFAVRGARRYAVELRQRPRGRPCDQAGQP